VLTALVPGSMILTAASTLISNDVYRGAINRQASDALVGRMARWLVPVVALVAIGFTLRGGDTIVALLLMGYSFVTQLFPALIASLTKRRRATKQGAMCGIVAGVAVVVVTTVMHLTIGQMFPFLPDALKDVNIGFLALALNIVVLVVVSALTQPRAATGDSREAGGALR
jgi:solute:Na+ symporter, SSS family